MRVGDMQITTLVRERSAAGMKSVSDSIQAMGWLEQFTPSVTVDQETMPPGIQPHSLLSGVEVSVLDGNHRVLALKNIQGPDFVISVRVYDAFQQRADAKVVANGECVL